jgi:hypothetical protein
MRILDAERRFRTSAALRVGHVEDFQALAIGDEQVAELQRAGARTSVSGNSLSSFGVSGSSTLTITSPRGVAM